MNLVRSSLLLESFRFVPKNHIRLDFLDCYLPEGESLFLHCDTGIISSALQRSPSEIAEYWSDVIFKAGEKPNGYTAALPYAQARLFYVLHTIIQFSNTTKVSINSLCDFATGEGKFLDLFRKEFPTTTLLATECSKQLCTSLLAKGFDIYNRTLGTQTGQNADFKVDWGVISWTLCNCTSPLEVLQDIRAHINDGGYIVVAESSRIMVPFKKSLNDLLNRVNPTDAHPWYFSRKSLSALLYISGFEPIFINRYRDSDILLIIARKIDLSKIPEYIECDSHNQVLDYLKRYAEFSEYFTTLDLDTP